MAGRLVTRERLPSLKLRPQKMPAMMLMAIIILNSSFFMFLARGLSISSKEAIKKALIADRNIKM